MNRWIASVEEDVNRRKQLDKHLARYNDSVSHWHQSVRKSGGQDFDLYVEDDSGELIAGLYGEAYFESFEIDRLWVAEVHRHQGLGSQLLQKALTFGLEQNCRFCHLTTFSFQAPNFYTQQGFEIVGELKDFPPGFSKYWLRRNY
jgi:GNAT superfamily N-acetyltransferase